MGQQQGDHLYEDTSNQNFGGAYPQQQPQVPPQQGYMQPSQLIPGGMLNEPMANMAFQYGSSIADQGKEVLQKNMEKYISTSTMKYYFAVDTKYVAKKLMLLLWPFSHQDWSTQYEQNQPVAPKFDINAPDLYIPVMAFVTFLLMNGLALGMEDRFTPEGLGIRASTAMTLFVFESYQRQIGSQYVRLDVLCRLQICRDEPSNGCWIIFQYNSLPTHAVLHKRHSWIFPPKNIEIEDNPVI